MIINNNSYKRYPKIRQEDIGSNTSNIFIDSLNMSNVNIGIMGADYDGDQVTIKGVFSEEANAELANHLENSKSHYFNLGGKGIRNSSNEAIQSMYNLTLCLPDEEKRMSDPVF